MHWSSQLLELINRKGKGNRRSGAKTLTYHPFFFLFFLTSYATSLLTSYLRSYYILLTCCLFSFHRKCAFAVKYFSQMLLATSRDELLYNGFRGL